MWKKADAMNRFLLDLYIPDDDFLKINSIGLQMFQDVFYKSESTTRKLSGLVILAFKTSTEDVLKLI